MRSPAISVVIPVFNCEKYVAEAVDSLLAQNYPNLEVIAVNDGSTDNTLAVLEKFQGKITVLTQQNRGPAVARNAGLRLAKGELLGLLDADDMWPANHIALALPHLGKDSPYDFVRGLTQYVRRVDDRDETTGPFYLEALVGACLYRREVFFDIVGLFDESMPEGEDFDWNVRLRERGCREKRLDDIMLIYRRHDNNLTNDPNYIQNGLINSFRKKIERSRKNGQQA
jgi:glycosyltransferase involved in cell wall biosynthesis